jgi:hypothetical protein
MRQEMAPSTLEEMRRLIETHRAWTARAFCMATAELRGSFEPDRATGARRRRQERRAIPAGRSDAF